MGRLEPTDHEQLLKVETARMAGIDPATLALEIPHIEGWTVHSVVGHTGWIFRYVGRCLESEPDEKPSRSSVGEPPVGAEVLGWFAESAEMLAKELAGTDLDALRPTWTGPQPARWWLRRLSHEVAIHRWDAYAPAGEPAPIDADQARDGIDEVLEVFVPNRMQFETLAGTGQTIHLHATDIEAGEWLLELQPDQVRWERSHAKGDVAARASASDLLLLLWSRIPPAAVETFGDAGLLSRWQQAATF
jgi:uncharacterized protein (TIGR03083 family)